MCPSIYVIKRYLQKRAYKRKLFDEAMKIVEERERRKAEYEAFIGQDLNYKIIKDFINQAQHNVVVEVTLKDGSKIVVRRQEDFDKLLEIRKDTW